MRTSICDKVAIYSYINVLILASRPICPAIFLRRSCVFVRVWLSRGWIDSRRIEYVCVSLDSYLVHIARAKNANIDLRQGGNLFKHKRTHSGEPSNLPCDIILLVLCVFSSDGPWCMKTALHVWVSQGEYICSLGLSKVCVTLEIVVLCTSRLRSSM